MNLIDSSPHTADAALGNEGASSVNRKIRDCVDVNITRHPGGEELDVALMDASREGFNIYSQTVLAPKDIVLPFNSFRQVFFQAMRYDEGSTGYTWHHDEMLLGGGVRTLSFIWYLNTLPEACGTQFQFVDKTVKPEQGKLLIFPSNWAWVHRGLPVEKDSKYIVTSWMIGGWTNPNDPIE